MTNRLRAFLLLAAVLPVPSVGVLMGMWWWPGTGLGRSGFLAAKVWMVVVPVVWGIWWWHRHPDQVWWRRQPQAWSRRWRALGAGLATGTVAGISILIPMWWWGPHLLHADALTAAVTAAGLLHPGLFLLAAVA